MKYQLLQFLILLCIVFLTSAINSPFHTNKSPEVLNPTVCNQYNEILDHGVSDNVFEYALNGYSILQSEGLLINDSLITIIDYSKPSSEERLFVIDIKNCKICIKSLVAHGKASGELFPEYFSNIPQSHQSSLGFFVTDQPYSGKNGYSLKLIGIEKNINDNAETRAIAFHGANYVSYEYLSEYGRLGRSFGCPALPPDKNHEIIDLIKNKSCVFIYYPANEYFRESKFNVTGNFDLSNFE